MRFKERNDLANRCKEWMKDQLKNNITTPLDTVHMVLAYMDVNGYLNGVVRCEDCIHCNHVIDEECELDLFECRLKCCDAEVQLDDYCSYGERRIQNGKRSNNFTRQ